MKNKLIITYSMLFLFAFTFGLSFTLASSVRADPCCPRFECPGEPACQSEWGHMVKGVCVYDGSHPCDFAFLCCD